MKDPQLDVILGGFSFGKKLADAMLPTGVRRITIEIDLDSEDRVVVSMPEEPGSPWTIAVAEKPMTLHEGERIYDRDGLSKWEDEGGSV